MLAHSSYLISTAFPNEDLWEKSLEGLVGERCAALKIPYLVLQEGAHSGAERM